MLRQALCGGLVGSARFRPASESRRRSELPPQPARIQTPRPTLLQGNPLQIGITHSIQAMAIDLACPQTPQISAKSILSPGNCGPASSG